VNATTTAPTRKVRATSTPADPHAIAPAALQPEAAAIQRLFTTIALALDEASLTDEPQEWSGDSDRLLRVASFLAERDAGRSYGAEEAECSAYDIAALIKAARLVPGDTESSKRSELIATAEAALVVLTEDSDCLVEGATRPPAPSRKNAASADALTDIDKDDLANCAMVVNGLVEWVISANDLLQDIRTWSLHDPTLDAALSTHKIRVNSPDWASCDMTNAMTYLLGHQKELIMKLAGAEA